MLYFCGVGLLQASMKATQTVGNNVLNVVGQSLDVRILSPFGYSACLFYYS